MRYNVWYDETNHFVRARVDESLTKDEAEKMMNEMEELLNKHKTRKGIMDLSNADSIRKVSKETRNVYKEHSKTLPLDKAAIIVNSPVLRMIAKVAVSALGSTMVARFVKSEEEALDWLKE